MSTPAASSPFDARPLIEPADRAAVRAYVRKLRAGGRAPAAATGARVVMAVIVGVVFAIVDDETLWFKADAESAALWDAAGCAYFTYMRDGTPQTMNYHCAPDDVYDDADAMREWAAPAIAAGRRAPRKAKRA